MDWAARYRDEDTPWDLGGPHPELARRLAAGELGVGAGSSARALVPGCGRGHDALALARAGWSVTALDLVALESPALDELARRGGELVVGDALAFRGPRPRAFELVLEHTFFCALPRERRGDWGRLVERSLAPGGRLACLVFPVGKTPEEGGPPFGTGTADLAAALGAGFALEQDEPVRAGATGRKWGERWALFRRARPER